MLNNCKLLSSVRRFLLLAEHTIADAVCLYCNSTPTPSPSYVISFPASWLAGIQIAQINDLEFLEF